MSFSSIRIGPGVRLRSIRSSWCLDVCRDYQRHCVNLHTYDDGEDRDEGRRLVRDVNAGRLSWDAPYITVEKAIEAYVLQLKQKHRAPGTVENAERMLARLTKWLTALGISRLAEVEQKTLDQYLAWLTNQRTKARTTISMETANRTLQVPLLSRA